MATQSNSSNAKIQAKRATTEARHSVDAAATANKKAAKKTIAAEKKIVAVERNQVQAVAEAAVDLPVGVVLTVSDRISELVEPWTGRASAEKQIKAYRAQLRRTLKRTERRGAGARRKATTQARKRQRSVESTIKRNRNEVESRVRRTIDEQTNRAQSLVDTVADQFAALR